MIQAIQNLYSKTELRHPRLSKLGRFVISGGTGAAVNIGTLFVLTHFAHLWYLLSSIIAFIVATCVSFVFQKFWTFKDASTDQLHSQAGVFIAVAGINLVFNTGLMYLCVDIFGFHYVAGQVVASIIIALESYFVYRKLFSFRAILQQ